MINVLVWLVAFLMQAGLLGTTMYGVGSIYGYICLAICALTYLTSGLQLISLSDLENDFVNPHDASAAINKWVVSVCFDTDQLLIMQPV